MPVLSDNPVLAVIVAGEIGFWVVLVAALAARYLLGRRSLSTGLLLGLPLIDLVVLGATVLDLRAGAVAGDSHGLAATYLGVTVAFGHSMVRWADQRFAHRFAGGPPPVRPPRSGPERVRHEWREWAKFALAWAIGCATMLGLILLVGDVARTDALVSWMGSLTLVLVIWLAWPVWATVSAAEQGARRG